MQSRYICVVSSVVQYGNVFWMMSSNPDERTFVKSARNFSHFD